MLLRGLSITVEASGHRGDRWLGRVWQGCGGGEGLVTGLGAGSCVEWLAGAGRGLGGARHLILVQ